MRHTWRHILALSLTVPILLRAQQTTGPQWLNADPNKKVNQSNFRMLEGWPVANDQRSASGAPGPRYWQQKVDYTIQATLDTITHTLRGTERVTYRNNSPESLPYLWFQLDQNVERRDSRAALAARPLPRNAANISPAALRSLGLGPTPAEELGMQIRSVKGIVANTRRDLAFVVNGTSMRIDLPAPLATGQATVLEIEWSYIIPEQGRNTQRNAREKLKDGYSYEVAQWYPRAAVFDDVEGWVTDQFYSQGEFYQEFGDFDVSVTVPHDHIVRGTGVLQNPTQVLTATQRTRLTQAMASTETVFIVRPDEVGTPSTRPAGTAPLTWRFTATNVRDFAFATSRTFVWDAMGFRYRPNGRLIELHSVYPKEGMPLWNTYSTKAIKQTMVTYGRMTIEYPYPVANNVHGSVGGMEYPMIAFCGARPRPDGTFDASLMYRLISVTIHEVGHNWFPMIVASDERKWGWMDEGMNSFVQYYAEKDWDANYPSRRGPAKNIVDYFKDPNQAPIMTEADVVFANYGNHSYAKPAASLVMLREQVLGTQSFDRAFKEYAERWAFKKPQPADFFRSVVSGAGEQLNWFWRGLFYTTYANDQAVAQVESQKGEELAGDAKRGEQYNRITIEQRGGLIMPIQLEVTYDDGSKELIKLPADVWRNNEKVFTHGFFSKRAIAQVVVDPNEVFADINRENNTWKAPPRVIP